MNYLTTLISLAIVKLRHKHSLIQYHLEKRSRISMISGKTVVSLILYQQIRIRTNALFCILIANY
jgi:hypothetical protein